MQSVTHQIEGFGDPFAIEDVPHLVEDGFRQEKDYESRNKSQL
jgi:hypothetical protein